MFIKNFRENFFKKKIKINGQEVLEAIQKNKEPVIFVSGHFNNFELLAMCIDKFNIPTELFIEHLFLVVCLTKFSFFSKI